MIAPSGRTYRERLTRVEFLVTLAILIPVGLIAVDATFQSTTASERQTCQANLKQIGQALQLYARESRDERYPLPKFYDCEGTIQPWSGAIDLTVVYPEYMSDLDLLVCPAYAPGRNAVEVWDEGRTTNPRWEAVDGFSNNGTVEPCEVLAKPYYYYGWAFAERLFEAAPQSVPLEPEDPKPESIYTRGLPMRMHYDQDVHNKRFAIAVASLSADMRRGSFDPGATTWDMKYSTGKSLELPRGSQVPALVVGAPRFYVDTVGDPQGHQEQRAKVVVMHEEIFDTAPAFYHGAGRMNVLYMDGHVENLRQKRPELGMKFPINRAGFILHDAVDGVLMTVP